MNSKLIAALLTLAAGSAAAAPVDITPARYHFHKGSYQNVKLSSTYFTTGNPKAGMWADINQEYDNGLILFGGNVGGAMRDSIVSNIKLVPMGLELGYVLCISDLNSPIGEELKAKTGYDYHINRIAQTGWRPFYNLNFYLDPTSTPRPGSAGSVKVSITYNIYSPAGSAMKANFANQLVIMDDNNAPGGSYTVNGFNTPEFTTDGSWDPEKWAVCEFTMPIPNPNSRIKLGTANGCSVAEGSGCALLIRDITLTYDNEATAPNAIAPVYNMVSIKPNDPDVTSSVDNAVAANNLSVSVNGSSVTASHTAQVYSVSGVKVASLQAGQSQQLAPGMYVATSAVGSVKFAI